MDSIYFYKDIAGICKYIMECNWEYQHAIKTPQSVM